LIAVVASAQAESFQDAADDADSLDVLTVTSTLSDATASVEVQFAEASPSDGAALRGVLLIGEPGAAEPAEWYQFSLANATHVFAAHGTPREVQIVAATWNGSVARIEFERSQSSSAACVFAVVESGLLAMGGFEVLDVAPHGFASPETAWPVDACPQAEPADESVGVEGKDSPSVWPLALFAILGVTLLARRR
jgi:MYXO-CTERM domain-containing protein